MQIEFYDKESKAISEDVVESLWNQNIDMDDWDYMIFFPIQYKCEFPDDWNSITVTPRNYKIEGLLRGCCRNEWRPVSDFMGRQGFLGMAYHS